MVRVHVPPLLRTLTAGGEWVEVEGATIRQVVAALESRYPGFKDRLC